MRVGIISLAHESNTFATTPTTFADFEQLLLLTGPAFGAGFSIYEGVHRIRYPAPIQAPIVSYVVLALAFLLKAARGCIH